MFGLLNHSIFLGNRHIFKVLGSILWRDKILQLSLFRRPHNVAVWISSSYFPRWPSPPLSFYRHSERELRPSDAEGPGNMIFPIARRTSTLNQRTGQKVAPLPTPSDPTPFDTRHEFLRRRVHGVRGPIGGVGRTPKGRLNELIRARLLVFKTEGRRRVARHRPPGNGNAIDFFS